jgi:methionine-rich copper-binding protein CopC
VSRPTVPPPDRRVGWLLAALVAGATLLYGAAPASAHASLVGASPADGSTASAAPEQVTLRFDENIRSPSVVIVTGPGGRRVDHGATTVRDNTAGVPVNVAQPGRYTVAFRVLSGDGHPVAGETTFSYRGTGSGSASTTPTTPMPASSVGGGSGSTGWVAGGVAVALLAAGGLLLFGRLSGRRRQPAASDTGADPTSGSSPGTARNHQ